jgi:hypothetical protein
MNPVKVWIGYDPREVDAFEVCRRSMRRHSSIPLEIQPLRLDALREGGWYRRPTKVLEDGTLWDVISNVPMSTEFSLSRFLVPFLCDFHGWAVFVDCDFLFRTDLSELLDLRDSRYAVQVVKHHYEVEQRVKMDGRPQKRYPRKNWSSLMLWNCGHEANAALDTETFNTATYPWLHQFMWLNETSIGPLPFQWNWIEMQPKAVHFSAGTPAMGGYEQAQYAEEWRSYLTHPEASDPPLPSP